MIDKRVATGIDGLDKMLHGGFVPGSAVLLRGAPGTGKTTLAFNYLVHGAMNGEQGMLITFEEFPQSLYRDAESLGLDLRRLEREGRLHMLFTSPDVFLQGLRDASGPVGRMFGEGDIQRIVLDSLTHFTRITNDTHELRNIYNVVVNALKREGATSLFVGEEMASDYTEGEKGRLSFIVDCIVMMRYLEIESAIKRAILVLKMRSSTHDKSIHGYTIGRGGIKVGDVIAGHSGLLSGLAKRSIVSSVK